MPTETGPDGTVVSNNITRDRTKVRSARDLAGRIVHKCLILCLDPVVSQAPNLRLFEIYETEL